MALLDIVKAGNQSVRIYTVKNRGRVYFKLAYHWAGEWRAKMVRVADKDDEKKARGIAREIVSAMSLGRASQIGNFNEGVSVLKSAQDSLAKTGVPVDVACREYAYATEMIDGIGTLIEAAEFYKRHRGSVSRDVAMRDAVEEFIEAQKADGASEKYLLDMRARLRRFARENGGFLRETKSADLKIWLRGLRVAPRTRNNFLTLIKTFFHWAQVENYLPRGVPTEADEVKKIAAPTEIYIHSADQVVQMLSGAIELDPQCIPYLAIGYFAGVRPKEMQRMNEHNIRSKHNDIEIKHWQAKGTRRKQHRRLVPMQPNLVEWLSEFPVESPAEEVGEPRRIAISTIPKRVWRIAHKLKIDWHHDVMRHTAISNMVALTQNVDQVALWCGNSRQIIYANYLHQITVREAKLFFSIVPPKIANVVRLQA